jgi:hypothetical protein
LHAWGRERVEAVGARQLVPWLVLLIACYQVAEMLRVAALVDAAVRSLCEVWNPHNIPAVFLTQSCLMTPSSSMHNILFLNGPSNSSVFTALVQQLPSLPITPPYLPGTSSSPHVSTAPRVLSRAATHIDLSSAEQARGNGNAAPLKTFVHEGNWDGGC